jgi:hypothetical protein
MQDTQDYRIRELKRQMLKEKRRINKAIKRLDRLDKK